MVWTFFKYIGGQACVNLCKLCKLVFTPKSDLNQLFQECGARDKRIKLSMLQSGFGKILLNHWDFGVCTWRNKVYTWPFLVCIGQILVYTLFAHHADRCSKAVILSVNRAIMLLYTTFVMCLMLWTTICLKTLGAEPPSSFQVYTKFD